MNRFLTNFLTIWKGKPEISETREISTPPIRETRLRQKASDGRALIIDSLICPYCSSKNFVKRGWRKKRMENVQLLMCNDCHKTFTPQSVKGKHYPLATIFDAISLYNLGYSLEESCWRVNEKRAPISGSSFDVGSVNPASDTRRDTIPLINSSVKEANMAESGGHDPQPLRADACIGRAPNLRDSLSSHEASIASSMGISPATLSSWISEFKDNLPFLRMRDFAAGKYRPTEMVETATLAHQQLFRYRFHRAKCQMLMQENWHHRSFTPLVEFLQMVPGECPHQYFQDGLRASEAPLAFSKTAMIVRGKTNYATKLAAFVLQGARERKDRHEILQKFMLYNDSVTVATEVPVYLTRDDLEHMRTQLGFELYAKSAEPRSATAVGNEIGTGTPKLITGHIDILQIRNGQVHILDYKPKAEKERPIEQLTLYAMALSRLTGLRLFEFKCAWFDEKDYFEFFPLHVLHKPKKAIRRKKVETDEGTYLVNKNSAKIDSIRPAGQGQKAEAMPAPER